MSGETKNLIAGRPKEFWDALAWLLAKERNRHREDIRKIDRDIRRLMKLGIEIPDPEATIWVDIPE